MEKLANSNIYDIDDKRFVKIVITKTSIYMNNYLEKEVKDLLEFLTIRDEDRKEYIKLYVKDEKLNKIYYPRISLSIILKYLDSYKVNYKIFISDFYNKDIKVNEVKFDNDKFKIRDSIQKGTIDFLKYEYYSRKIIALATGLGKTFCALKTCSDLKLIPLIVCRKTLLLSQWLPKIKEYTDCKEDEIFLISGKESIDNLMKRKYYYYYYYLASPHTLLNYILEEEGNGEKLNELFNKLGIGVKIIDETHNYLGMVAKIESQLHVKYNWYLSATPGRTSFIEQKMFYYMFNNVPIHGRETASLNDHHNVFYVDYESLPSNRDIFSCNTKKGFSPAIYFRKLFNNPNKKKGFINMIFNYIDKFRTKKENDGKILIFLCRLEDIKYCAEIFEEKYKNNESIGTYCTLVDETKKEEQLTKSIIFTTIRSAVDGLDLNKLQLVLSLSTFSSHIYATQLIGRLRPYIGKEVYLIDFCDINYKKMINQRFNRSEIYNKYCKKKINHYYGKLI